MPVRDLHGPVLAAWLVWQFQRGVDESVSFERFPPGRQAHSASDLEVPIG
jgi:hypothetical protein